MKILVTGGAGFIGSHTVDELLARGHEPAVFDDLSSGSRDNLPADVPFFQGDIRDEAAVRNVFETVRPDRVCHLAAQMSVSRSVREPAFDADVNIVGLLQVIEQCQQHNVEKIVFASSGGALYGDVSEPVPETHPCEPGAPYGISKLVGEKYLDYFSQSTKLSATVMRYTNVYGPRQNPHGEAGVVAIFSTLFLNAKPAIINGDGKYLRDYVYVTDVAKANASALEADFDKPFVPLNVGTGIKTDVNELEAAVRSACQQAREQRGLPDPIPPSPHGEARAGDLRSSVVSHKKLTETLNWSPAVNFSEGVQQTVAWFAEQSISH